MSSDRPLNAGWDEDPAGYDERRRCWLNDRRVAVVSAELPAGEATVLELGSGTGWLLRRLAAERPDVRFVGLEPLEGYVAFAAREPAQGQIGYVTGIAEDAATLLAGERFDLVLSNDVLHHVEDLERVCAAVAAVARPGARWLALEPNPANPYVRVRHTVTAGEAVFDAPAFLSAAARAGWRLLRRGNLFLVPPQVGHAPGWMAAIERRLESRARLAGGLALELELGA